MNRPRRDILAQEWIPKAFIVGTTPTPLTQGSTQSSIQALYDSILICIPSTVANSVWMGDSSIDPAAFNGVEFIAKEKLMFSINNERQIYELQSPLIKVSCDDPEGIPFIAWDVSQIFFRAVAPTTIGILLFKAPYI